LCIGYLTVVPQADKIGATRLWRGVPAAGANSAATDRLLEG
jgi:hypothetical protein